jgi:thiamine-phosphate pyrophosphorylase
MRRGQTFPRTWLIIADAAHRSGLEAAMRLPRGTGVLLLRPLARKDERRLRLRELIIVREGRTRAARVHNAGELRRALLARTPVIFLSPIYPTRSHPDWRALPRMRAAALARLGGRRLFALGGMSARRFARVQALGFQGWAGISAWKPYRE